jgi:glycosyltransferase involved in cell wall biosynthesis
MPSVDAGSVEISIVMPCLNEARTLPACIEKALRAIRDHGLAAEVIVADNGSDDGSAEIAQRLGARVVHVAERGYGAALLAGIEAARAPYVIMGDADDSYDFGAIVPFLERLRAGDDLVMGCRLPSGGGTILPGAMPWKHRWLGNPALSAIGRRLFHCPVTDFHCGLRGFRRDFVLSLDLRTTGMELASEMVIKSTIRRGRISEVPITLYPDGRGRAPHLRSWRDGWRHLRFMMLMSPRWLFLVPGLLLVVAGAVVCAALLPGPLHFSWIGFDTSTMLVGAMMLLLGFQVIVYAFFSRLFAVSEGLLPPDPLLNKIFRYVTLETGIIAGSTAALGGLLLLIYATVLWGQHGFGPIDYSKSQRIVIPAVTAIIVGVQIVFSSFFLSMLGLRRR